MGMEINLRLISIKASVVSLSFVMLHEIQFSSGIYDVFYAVLDDDACLLLGHN